MKIAIHIEGDSDEGAVRKILQALAELPAKEVPGSGNPGEDAGHQEPEKTFRAASSKGRKTIYSKLFPAKVSE